MKAGGKIRLNSCSTGRGDVGQDFAQHMGKAYLKEGGRVYSANVSVDSPYEELAPKAARPLIKGAKAVGSFNPFVYQFGLALGFIAGEKPAYAKTRETIIPPTSKNSKQMK